MKTSGIHQFLPVSEADRKTNIGGAKRKLYEGLTQDMGKRSLKKWKDRKPRDNDNEISPAQVGKIHRKLGGGREKCIEKYTEKYTESHCGNHRGKSSGDYITGSRTIETKYAWNSQAHQESSSPRNNPPRRPGQRWALGGSLIRRVGRHSGPLAVLSHLGCAGIIRNPI